MPWTIPLGRADVRRIGDDPWVTARLGGPALAVLRTGVLPVVERQRRPACVFLDDDMLCGLQKERGHDFLPRACRSFPFDFTRDEQGRRLASLSRLCRSVRDDRGRPALPMLDDKLREHGRVDDISASMTTLGGVVLNEAQYVRLVRRWEAKLCGSDEPLSVLVRLFAEMAAFERALPDDRHEVGDRAIAEAMAVAAGVESLPLQRTGLGRHGWMLFAHVLGHLCYPARVMLNHRADPPPWYHLLGLRGLWMRVRWLLGVGSVDLLFVDRPVPLRRVERVASPTRGEHGRRIARFLVEALRRRRLFTVRRPLQAVLLDLALAAVLASRFARCRAAAAGRSVAEEADVAEGVGVSELMVISHVSPSPASDLLGRLRWAMLSRPRILHGILGAEST